MYYEQSHTHTPGVDRHHASPGTGQWHHFFFVRSSLNELRLSSNGITDNGITALLVALSLSNSLPLTDLWLVDNEIGSSGMKDLDYAMFTSRKLGNLKNVFLRDNPGNFDTLLDHILQSQQTNNQ